jgi:hypothetical protein
MSFFRGMAYGTAFSETDANRKTALRAEVGEQLVDTCLAFDTGMWETGIKRDGDWTIVEKYADEETARVGHEKWLGELTANPQMDLTEVGIDEWLGD